MFEQCANSITRNIKKMPRNRRENLSEAFRQASFIFVNLPFMGIGMTIGVIGAAVASAVTGIHIQAMDAYVMGGVGGAVGAACAERPSEWVSQACDRFLDVN